MFSFHKVREHREPFSADRYERARADMVARQIVMRGIADERIREAISELPRHLFVPVAVRDRAYEDSPLPIGEGQTISQPYMAALMTEKLDLRPEHTVLEIGTGSGYQAAILGRLAREVHTVERVASLARRAESLLAQLGFENVIVHEGDGSLGWLEEGPYDRVLVTAAAPHIPQELERQLVVGGRLVCPVGEREHQQLVISDRTSTGWDRRSSVGCIFVPLVGADGWYT